MKPDRRAKAPLIQVQFLRDEDQSEYKRLKDALVKSLEKQGGYEPAVDDLHVDAIARTTIYAKRVEAFLDLETATEHTYAMVTDAQLKLRKTIETALHELALTRRDRLLGKTEKSIRDELREALLRVVKNAGQ